MRLITELSKYLPRGFPTKVFTLFPDSAKLRILPLILKLEEKNLTIDDITLTINVTNGFFDYGINGGVDSNGHYEVAMGEKFVKALKILGKVDIIDIGSGIGYYSILASRIIPSQNIHAFEPEIFNHTLFQLNNNKYCYGNIKLNKLFVGNEVNKYLTTLDEYCFSNNLSPGLIKIDIEGWEYYAIDGMIKVLGTFHPLVLIEFHERKLRQLFGVDSAQAKNTINKIEKLGYSIQYNGHHYFTNRNGGIPSREWVEKPPNDVNYAIFCSPI